MKIPFLKNRKHRSIITLLSALSIISSSLHAAPETASPSIGQTVNSGSTESLSGDLTFPDVSITDRYFIGVGIFGDIAIAEDGTLLLDTDEILVNNSGSNSGAIGLGISEATVGAIHGNISAVGHSIAYGIKLSGDQLLANNLGINASISEITGRIEATATSGSAIGIDLTNGAIESISGADIHVNATLPATREVPLESDGIRLLNNSTIDSITNTSITATLNASNNGAAVNGISMAGASSIGKIENLTLNITNNSATSQAVGLSLNTTGEVGKKNGVDVGINANISVTVNDGLAAFISTNNTENLGTISGNYVMNVHNTKGGASATTYSAGYVLGDEFKGTFSSIGFTASTADGSVNSAGFNIDWNNTSMSIHRDYGYSTGVVVMGSHAELENTVLGANCNISSSVKEGLSVAAWFTGTDLSGGSLQGDLSAKAEYGSAFGLAGTATDLVDSWIIDQNYGNSIFADIAGNISATVDNEASGIDTTTKVVGVQLGNLFVEGGVTRVMDTEVTGAFSGNISAVLNDTVNADGSLQNTSAGNVVAGIIDMGNQTLKFDGTIQGENNAQGTQVSALIYNQEDGGKVLRAYGDAILTINGGIKLSSEGTTASTSARFEGNLTAGYTSGNAGQESLQFEKGHFTVTSEAWNAQAGITVGSLADSSVTKLYETARVTLTDIASTVGDTTSFNSDSLTFYANNMGDSSLITAASGVSLELEGLTMVNIYLSGVEAEYGSLYFLDATQAEAFDADNSGITYNLYLNGVLHTQDDSFKIVHDASGIYLSAGAFIPEPSTATLSIIALIGLLQRRRRKA